MKQVGGITGLPDVLAIAVAIALASGLASSASAGTACSFPGHGHECPAPSGGGAVEWREPTADHDHELWLKRSGEAPIRLAEFGRSAEVLWSGDGRTIAITDHSGSSDSSAWVVSVSSPRSRETLEAAFNRSFGRPPDIYRHGHRYFVALSWISPERLLFEVRAHDAAPEAAYRATFLYDLDGTVRRSNAK